MAKAHRPPLARRASITDSDVTEVFPELTTVFTPPSDCTKWYISECTSTTDCFVEAFPTGTGICNSNGTASEDTLQFACYPTVGISTETVANGEDIRTLEVATYSPGFHCPLGMSTATSIALLDGVFCCPSGMTFQGDLQGGTCARTQTEGTFILSSACTPTTIPRPSGSLTTTISMYAMPVFLGGQKLLSPFSSTTSTTHETPKSSAPTLPPAANSNSSGSDISNGVYIIIAISVLTLALLLTTWYCVRRYRKRRRALKMQQEHSRIKPSDMDIDKPELVGSTLQQEHIKPELDPLATRAELEAPIERDGSGIHVYKPELQAGDLTIESKGLLAFVKKKAELQGTAV